MAFDWIADISEIVRVMFRLFGLLLKINSAKIYGYLIDFIIKNM